MYGDSVPDPTEFYFHRFATDNTLFGSHTTRPIGVNPKDAQRRLAAPFGRLYFAPEDAVDEVNIGIPFAAILDGTASANELVACMLDGNCEKYTPEEEPCGGKKMRKMGP